MSNISKQCKVGFISTLVWGILAHGMGITNKFSFHDDMLHMFDMGYTYQSGRWMLEIMKNLEELFFGGSMYSMPLYNGVVCILCIATIVALFIDLFEIKNNISCIAMGGVMVTFPVITGMFGYMFTAPAYMLGLLMGIFGAYLICKYRKWYIYIASMILCACCVGVYQAFIPMMVCVFVVYMIKTNIENSDKVVSDIIKEIVYYVAACVGFMIIYFICNKIALRLYGATLVDYKGINTMGVTSLEGYLQRIILAYKEFFLPDTSQFGNMYPMSMIGLYRVVLVLVVLGSVYYLYKTYRKNIWSGIYVTALVLIFPMVTNFMYVMCDIDAVHSLTVYGKVFVLIYLILLGDKLIQEENWKKYVAKFGVGIAIVIAVMYCRYDNACYMKAEMQQSQLIQYYSTLVTQIKCTEGYSDELPVVFVNMSNISDSTITKIPEFEDITLLPYNYDTHELVNNYACYVYMSRWCGYSPIILDENLTYGDKDVESMPSYPEDGSIQVINGIIVVKF